MTIKLLHDKLSSLCLTLFSINTVLEQFLNNDPKLKQTAITLLNYLFAVEYKAQKAESTEKTKLSAFAQKFSKILANLTGDKIKIQIDETLTLAAIDKEYNELVTQLSQDTAIPVKTLTNEIPVTEQSIAAVNSKIEQLRSEKFTKTDAAAAAGVGAAIGSAWNNQNQNKSNSNQAGNNFNSSSANSNWNIRNNPAANPFAPGNINPAQLAQMQQDLPPDPFQDPRFYPYTKKWKYMPILKMIIGILLAISLILFIVQQSWGLSLKFDLTVFKDAAKTATKTESFPLATNATIWTLIIAILILLPSAFYFLRPPKLKRDSYYTRPSLPICIIIGLVLVSLIAIILIGDGEVTNALKNRYKIAGDADAQIQKNVLDQSKFISYQIFSYFAGGFSIFSALVTASIFIFNPRLDHKKIALAREEYMKAVYSKMQGKDYTINPAIYDEDLADKKEETDDI